MSFPLFLSILTHHPPWVLFYGHLKMIPLAKGHIFLKKWKACVIYPPKAALIPPLASPGNDGYVWRCERNQERIWEKGLGVSGISAFVEPGLSHHHLLPASLPEELTFIWLLCTLPAGPAGRVDLSNAWSARFQRCSPSQLQGPVSLHLVSCEIV